MTLCLLDRAGQRRSVDAAQGDADAQTLACLSTSSCAQGDLQNLKRLRTLLASMGCVAVGEGVEGRNKGRRVAVGDHGARKTDKVDATPVIAHRPNHETPHPP